MVNNQAISEIKGKWSEGKLTDLIIEEAQNEINRLKFFAEEKKLQITYRDGSTYVGHGILQNNSLLRHGYGLFTNPTRSYEYNGHWS